MLRKWMLALCFCLGIFGCGCSETTSDESSTASSEAVTATTQSADEKTTRDLFAMDTYITLTAYGNNAEAGISAAERVLERFPKIPVPFYRRQSRCIRIQMGRSIR